MELGPIFRSLFYNKARFALIALEVALTLAIVVNCMSMVLDQRDTMTRPTGLAEGELLVVTSRPFAPDFEDEAYLENSYEEDLRTMRAIPGVASVTGSSIVPLSGGGSSSSWKPVGSEEDSTGMAYFIVGPDALATFGVELASGRDFVEADFAEDEDEEDASGADERPIRSDNVLVTQAAADRMFPDGDALGQGIETSNGQRVDKIVGIVRHMHGPWPTSSVAERNLFYPGKPFSGRRVIYMVRTEPDQLEQVYPQLETALLGVNEGRIVDTESLDEVKAGFYDDQVAIMTILLGVSLLLVGVTSLGIVGLTAFSVAQRTRQIGTRRALGATRIAILRYFLVENWLISATGLTIGVGLTFGLNFLLAQVADAPRMEWSLVLGGMAILWIAGLAASLIPALRGTGVSPVVATRSV